ncbi:MAG: hypothetical protein JO048_11370 [Methylobacteriaceae bacterium]|nr:hypothetical protein [Methylobacteriaceae bacterium]
MHLPAMTFLAGATCLLAAALTGPASSAWAAEPPVAVLVAVPTPAKATRAALETGMSKSVPEYRRVPGLLRKYFTIGSSEFGGVYLFASRAAAESWFDEGWRRRIVATYGAPASVTYLDVPIVLDNAEPPAAVIPGR